MARKSAGTAQASKCDSSGLLALAVDADAPLCGHVQPSLPLQ
jgi:hypothetical protein